MAGFLHISSRDAVTTIACIKHAGNIARRVRASLYKVSVKLVLKSQIAFSLLVQEALTPLLLFSGERKHLVFNIINF